MFFVFTLILPKKLLLQYNLKTHTHTHALYMPLQCLSRGTGLGQAKILCRQILGLVKHLISKQRWGAGGSLIDSYIQVSFHILI